LSPFPAEKTRTKTDRKRLNANFEQLGNDEMAEFVKDNSRTEYEDKAKR
jgi:hypothetical protein